MIELKYKTRGNSSAKGKPKVYFSASEIGFKFFDEICDDILSKQDCAIYYLDNKEELNEEDLKQYHFLLSQMQLFVFAITEDFLKSDTLSFKYDYTYAMENKFPILPLIFGDNKLAPLFNEKCGNIQFLNKYVIDNTAISYDKKISDFLSNCLFDEELVKKVKEAFDAYIFLSYRKKDRYYANIVMNAIHENDFARDIAIWFDEFLVPGEDFNDSIDEVLKKSELFALVVTPSIIEKDNYVMRVEYPNAKELNKKILPIITKETDEKDLNKYYKDFPKKVDINDKEILSEELLKNLKNIAIRENDTPIHNFYIAMAYLYGIDVEVNKERALKILEDSASKGCINAIEKLATMYEVGDMVAIDYKKALDLKLKALFEYEKMEDSDDKLKCLAVTNKQIGDFWMQQIKYERWYNAKMALPYFIASYNCYEKLTDKDYNFEKLELLMAINNKKISFKYRKKFNNLIKLVKSSEDANIQRLIARKYFGNAITCIVLRLRKKAKRHIENSLSILEEIKDDNPDALTDLLTIHFNLANMYMRGNAKESERLYLHAIELATEHKFDNKDITYLKGMLQKNLGELYVSMYLTDYKKAREWLNKAFETFNSLDEGLKEIAASEKISIYNHMVIITDDLDEEIELRKKQLVLIQNNKYYDKAAIIDSKLNLVEAYRQNKIIEHRKEYLFEILEEIKELKDSTIPLLTCYQQLCFYYGDIEEAKPLLEYANKGLELSRSLEDNYLNKEEYIQAFEMYVNIAKEHMDE